MPRQQYTSPSSSNKNSNTHVPRFINHTGPIMQGSPHTPTKTAESPKQSFKQLIKEGFAFGLGSTIGRNLVNSFSIKPASSSSSTSSSSTPSSSTPSPPTNMENQLMYDQCIKEGGNHETCKEYIV